MMVAPGFLGSNVGTVRRYEKLRLAKSGVLTHVLTHVLTQSVTNNLHQCTIVLGIIPGLEFSGLVRSCLDSKRP